MWQLWRSVRFAFIWQLWRSVRLAFMWQLWSSVRLAFVWSYDALCDLHLRQVWRSVRLAFVTGMTLCATCICSSYDGLCYLHLCQLWRSVRLAFVTVMTLCASADSKQSMHFTAGLFNSEGLERYIYLLRSIWRSAEINRHLKVDCPHEQRCDHSSKPSAIEYSQHYTNNMPATYHQL